ncbi:MAG: glucosaminidase domain-containing protein [Bacteroidales bacterium]|nr:glucosaminidase domain-containing protein [Bacteroidales bacterium]MCF8388059.1 glucosaminidase domain-containing protein [Bacteroidales bacterium]MCF8398884.1 glucosaminidase domain-containing protein [Bacteroidales bacterium]
MHSHSRIILFTFMFILLLFSCRKGANDEHVSVLRKKLQSPQDIENIDSSLVKPWDYTNALSLAKLPVGEKKRKFIHMMLPAILVAKEHIKKKREWVGGISNEDTASFVPEDKEILLDLMQSYRAENTRQLMRKLTPPPNSLVLAQAALESGWGTSRFFTEANNVFGIWSFDSKEPRMKSRFSRGDTDVYLKKYEYLSASIEDYYRTIARGPYRAFRIKNMKTDNPYELIPLLNRYSENDSIYAIRLKYVIKFNDLLKYDNYRIDPRYLKN